MPDDMLMPAVSPIHLRQIDAAVALLAVQLEEHHVAVDLTRMRDVLRKVVNDERYGFILVATADDEKVVGVALSCAFLGLEHGGESGWLEEVYVLPEWRQRGVGGRLVDEAIRVATARGWRALDLEVESDHQRVVSLYARHGFQARSRSRLCRKLD